MGTQSCEDEVRALADVFLGGNIEKLHQLITSTPTP